VRAPRARLKHPLAAYPRRFTYDTLSHSAEALRYLLRLVGADRVMVGSDCWYKKMLRLCKIPIRGAEQAVPLTMQGR